MGESCSWVHDGVLDIIELTITHPIPYIAPPHALSHTRTNFPHHEDTYFLIPPPPHTHTHISSHSNYIFCCYINNRETPSPKLPVCPLCYPSLTNVPPPPPNPIIPLPFPAYPSCYSIPLSPGPLTQRITMKYAYEY